jgi:hypothetical protein
MQLIKLNGRVENQLSSVDKKVGFFAHHSQADISNKRKKKCTKKKKHHAAEERKEVEEKEHTV